MSASRKHLDWSRKLPRTLTIPTVMTLRTLADVRTLMSHLPADRKRMDTWKLVERQLKTAAAGGDIDQLAMTLRLVLFLEHVDCR